MPEKKVRIHVEGSAAGITRKIITLYMEAGKAKRAFEREGYNVRVEKLDDAENVVFHVTQGRKSNPGRVKRAVRKSFAREDRAAGSHRQKRISDYGTAKGDYRAAGSISRGRLSKAPAYRSNPQVGDYELTIQEIWKHEGRLEGSFQWKNNKTGREAKGGSFSGYVDGTTKRFRKFSSGGYGGGMNPPEAVKQAAAKILLEKGRN